MSEEAKYEDDGKLATLGATSGYKITKEELASMTGAGVKERNKANLANFGYVDGLADLLAVSPKHGIKDDEVENRQAVFGKNVYPEPEMKGFWFLFFESFKDVILIILIVAAVVSLGVGTYEDQEKGWIDGIAILLAVLIVAFVTAGNDYSKERQFRALNDEKGAMSDVCLLRGGKEVHLHPREVVVGDIMVLENGAKVYADLVVVDAVAAKTDESALTGESDALTKVKATPENIKDEDTDPFLLSDSNLCNGKAVGMVIAVGIDSYYGQIKLSLTKENEDTPLQVKLDDMAKKIGYFGAGAAVATFIALIVVFFARGDDGVVSHLIESFIIAITIVVVAIPEGLPLAVTISLAYSTRKMLKDKNLIRTLAACETMGNATDICSDKTGTLTENRMTIVQTFFPFGGADMRVNLPNTNLVEPGSRSENWALIPGGDEIKKMLVEHMVINSDAVIERTVKDGEVYKTDHGSKTEIAFVQLVESLGREVVSTRADVRARTERSYPFSSKRKMRSSVVKVKGSTVYRIYVTGGSDMVLKCCDSVLTNDDDGSMMTEPINDEYREKIRIDEIDRLAEQQLRTLVMAYREFKDEDALKAELGEDWKTRIDPSNEEDVSEVIETNLTFYALVGIKDPLRPDVSAAVESCTNRAGIRVRMVTGDNPVTAFAIARECGIMPADAKSADVVFGGPEFLAKSPAELERILPEKIVMVGPDFRSLSFQQMDAILPRLRVLARSSPVDKFILVSRLNGDLPTDEKSWLAVHPGMDYAADRDKTLPGYKDEWVVTRKHPNGTVFSSVVGVTGDGTNDAPALRVGNVGLAMGKSGTEVAKDAADIIILDDKFSSIVKAVLWGRSVYDNIRKFLQFQLTVNVVALVLTFISAVQGVPVPLNAVMMLWVNLIMDTMGALALGTEPPIDELLDRKPFHKEASLISTKMWRHIFGQSIFQLVLLLLLLNLAEDWFDMPEYEDELDSDEREEKQSRYLNTFIFNTFVFCQVFNEFNARSIDDEWNIFAGLHNNFLFMAVIVITVGLQAFIVEVGGDFTKTVGLSGIDWLWSIIMGLGALPVGILMRLPPIDYRESQFAYFYEKELNEVRRSKLEAAAVPVAHGKGDPSGELETKPATGGTA